MDEQQSPMTVWCGGENAYQDISILLVPNEINQQQVTNARSRETLAVLKVHSNRLKECSKYFEMCLSERWTHPNSSSPSIESRLEVIHGLQVECYIDCFSRMYTPFRKDFKDVKSSLKLLRVASQIEFHELMSSICQYLSTIIWSNEDELRIWQFSSSLDFPCRQAKDLVARLELGGPRKEDSRKQLRDLMEHCIRRALRCKRRRNRLPKKNFSSARSLLEELLLSIGHSGSSAYEKDLVMIISEEAQRMLVEFHEECFKEGMYDIHRQHFLQIFAVPGFEHKLEGICWVLKVLLRAKVAEEVVEWFLLLGLYPSILAGAAESYPFDPHSHTRSVAIELARLVLLIYREVVAGNLLLGIPLRVALLENWQLIHVFHEPSTRIDILKWGYVQAVEDVFLTLPFRQQMELVKRRKFDHHDVISTNSLASLVKRKWQAEENALLQAEVEVDVGVSDASLEFKFMNSCNLV